MNSAQLRRIAAQLIAFADALDAQAVTSPPNAAQRVLDAFQRAPRYAERFPAFADCLNAHAMTITQITKAIGGDPNARNVVHEGVKQLLAAGTIQRVQRPPKRPGRQPEMYVLTGFEHHFPAPGQVNATQSDERVDPFAHEYVPPWRKDNG